MKISRYIAKFFSWVLSPMLLPFYGMIASLWLTPYIAMPVAARYAILAVTLLITGVLPAAAILILYKLGYISDPGLNRQSERLVPYVITFVCYAAEVMYLYTAGAPRWMWLFMVGAAIAVVVSATVNLKWKISGHMAGIGGLTALVFRFWVSNIGIYPMWICAAIALLLSGLLGTSRILLNCHTLGQVTAGWLNGFLWVYVLTGF